MKVVLFLSCVILAGAAPKKYTPVHPNMDLIEQAGRAASKKYTPVHPNMDLIEQAGSPDLSLESRIVGGSNAEISDYPWQVSLRQYNNHICGAVILDSTHVLTAAHCTQNSGYSIRAGSHFKGSGGQTRNVQRVTNHPSYDSGSGTFPNDIAILELESALTMGNNVQAIGLATSSSEPAVGSVCVLTGWGRTSGGSTLPSRLKYVEMDIISNTDCQNEFNGIGTIISSHICIDRSGKSACNGDSGGPMTCYRSNGDAFLAGVTSWGINGCPGTYPSVYTRVSSFKSWIEG